MIWVGTSGYNYPEWKGSFYPADLAAEKMLPYYAARFPTVEINYTFYRMPTEKLVGGWAAQMPSPYQAHAQGAAAHHARQPAEGRGRLVARFCEVAATLGDKLGTLLFQLPPFLRKDLALFDAFLPQLPAGVRAAFEFRHASWFDEDVFEPPGGRETSRSASPTARSCRRRCVSPPTTRTSGCGTRATRPTTSSGGPTRSRARQPRCKDVFVYFKHEEAGKGPEFARLLMESMKL